VRRSFLLTVLALVLGAGFAAAAIPLGATAPAFTKTKLSGGMLSLSEYNPGKVVVLFLLGYS
jgi:hypothetical protein